MSVFPITAVFSFKSLFSDILKVYLPSFKKNNVIQLGNCKRLYAKTDTNSLLRKLHFEL